MTEVEQLKAEVERLCGELAEVKSNFGACRKECRGLEKDLVVERAFRKNVDDDLVRLRAELAALQERYKSTKSAYDGLWNDRCARIDSQIEAQRQGNAKRENPRCLSQGDQ